MSIALDQVLRELGKSAGPDHHGWYTALCPFHDDKRRPNLRLREGGFRCMTCGEKGNLKKLAARLGTKREEGKHMALRIVGM